jgi:hypothetical protein
VEGGIGNYDITNLSVPDHPGFVGEIPKVL